MPFMTYNFSKSRSSRLEVFCDKGVAKNFEIFTGKHLSWNLFLTTLLQRDSNRVVFGEYYEIFKNIHFGKHLRTAASVKVKGSIEASLFEHMNTQWANIQGS